MMRKILVFICLVSVCAIVRAGEDRAITVDRLPANSQAFIRKHFKIEEVSYAKQETDFLDKSYEVVMVNGDKIEFGKDGEWKEINCKYTSVPELIVPKKIRDYLKDTKNDLKIVQIERDRHGYEVELGNGLELHFNKRFKFLKYDR